MGKKLKKYQNTIFWKEVNGSRIEAYDHKNIHIGDLYIVRDISHPYWTFDKKEGYMCRYEVEIREMQKRMNSVLFNKK